MKPATLRSDPRELTSGRVLARNGALNLGGHLAPLVVALVAIPLLIDGIGTERFGVLTVAWMAIGYFTLFDFGLGRALTQLVAERTGTADEAGIPALVWTAQLAMLAFGALGGLVLWALTPWLVHRVLNIPAVLHGETIGALHLLALAMPWVVGTAGLRGLLEARQRFGLVNAVRVPMGVLSFLGPVAVLPFSRSLVPVVATLAVIRVAAWVAHLALCIRAVPELRRPGGLAAAELRRLARFGGWMTVSNVVSPIMVYFDRFLIGALLTMTAVAYYATPYEVVAKLLVVPGALLGVFFPAFTIARGDQERLRRLSGGSARILIALVFPAVLLIVAFAEEGMQLWLGAEFARNSTTVLRLLAAGVLVNTFAQVPFSVLQGLGRPDITGKLHLLEVGPYLAAIWLLTARLGIDGAAIAWLARVSADAVLLCVATMRVSRPAGEGVRSAGYALVPALGVLALAGAMPSLAARAVFVGAAAPLLVWLAWTRLLSDSERALLHDRLPKRWTSRA